MLQLFPLQKMKIVQLKENLIEDPSKVFNVMFNPANYTEKYGLDSQVNRTVSGRDNFTYSSTNNETMNFDLMLDATNTNKYLPEALLRNISVEDKLKAFFDIAGFEFRGEAKKPVTLNRLRILYGQLRYDCILTNVVIEYLLFDQDGIPLRARLKTTFRALPDSLKPEGKRNTVGGSEKDAIELTLSVS